jgi:hypothetical protein
MIDQCLVNRSEKGPVPGTRFFFFPPSLSLSFECVPHLESLSTAMGLSGLPGAGDPSELLGIFSPTGTYSVPRCLGCANSNLIFTAPKFLSQVSASAS